MCYDTAQLAYKIYKDAVRLKGSPEEIEYLKDKWKRLREGYPDFHHASGFQHPELLVFSKPDGKLDLSRSIWGLIPAWTESEERAQKLWNNTIIARGESMFEKPSFREAAMKNRCIIPIDGFFEHFHQSGKTFPYYIERKDKKRMLMGGIKSSWTNPVSGEIIDSFAIITTKANELMETIHNNPKVPESRMPLLLNESDIDTWFEGAKEEVMQLIQPNTSQELITKTVKPIRGKQYIGNTPEATEEFEYAEITGNSGFGQTSMF
jgi:putative SOS response-associated peptidase YedK